MRLAMITALPLLAFGTQVRADGARPHVWFVRAGTGLAAADGGIHAGLGEWWTVGAGLRPRTWLSVSANLGWTRLPAEELHWPTNWPLDAGSLTIESALSLPVHHGLTPFLSMEAGAQHTRQQGEPVRAVEPPILSPLGAETALCSEIGAGLAIVLPSDHGRLEASIRIRTSLAAHPWSTGGLRVAFAYWA